MPTNYVSRVDDIYRISKGCLRDNISIQLYVYVAGLVIEGQRLLLEGSKSGAISETQMRKLGNELQSLLHRKEKAEKAEQSPIPESVAAMKRMQSPRSENGAISIPEKSVEFDSQRVEEDMLRIAGDMREVAMNVKSTLQRDRGVLSTTAELQESNLDATARQNTSAKGVRSAKRLSFMMTILMVVSSVVIFLAIIPVILVT